MNKSLSRRNFFKLIGVASIATSAKANTNQPKTIGSIIDLGLCDGCKSYDMPMCVKACRTKNESIFPQPIENIPDYFPRKGYEDHSKNKNDISYLSPYNFTYIQEAKVDDKTVFIPRRCMHCDDPTCQKTCPFGVIHKEKNGAVIIDYNGCMGGSKCKEVCPWHIPQRQAGVGIYLKIAPMFAGGGVMYKCDSCADLLAKNERPVCETSCPKNAILFMDKDEALKIAKEKAKIYASNSKYSGTFIYGDKQNGGTSTFYVSPVPFEKIQNAIKEDIKNAPKAKKQKITNLNVNINNKLNDSSSLVTSILFMPLLGIIAGSALKSRKKDEDK